MSTRVVHVSHSPYDVYIGRAVPRGGVLGSKWGNPIKLAKDATMAERIECLKRYERYLRGRPDLMAALPELKNKTLGCWCHPLPCHGDVLARLADELP